MIFSYIDFVALIFLLTVVDWKLRMDLPIKDEYRFEDYICLSSITDLREVSFRKLLPGTIITIITILFIASEMYDVLLNVRKTKVIENEQDNLNNIKENRENGKCRNLTNEMKSKETRGKQHINGKCGNQPSGITRNQENEPCNPPVVRRDEQEVNESDVIRAKKHVILEREECRLMHLVMCKICLDADARVVFLPCSHMVACRVCADYLERCPVCRAIIDEFLQVNQTD